VKVRISEILVDPTIQIRRSNHEQTIQRYMAAFDKLPPVDVFRTPDGDLLADGFHRVASAERLGLAEIEANVHNGSRLDALEFAVVSNTKNADPLTNEERDTGVRRLKQIHPDWSNRQIADAMSLSYQTVARVFQIDEVKRATVTGGPAGPLTDTHYREVASAPKETWQPLVRAAQERGWSTDETATAVQALRDDRIPQEHKEALLRGDVDPLIVTSNGDLGIPIERVTRVMREQAESDGELALRKALGAIANVRAVFSPAQTVETMTAEYRRQVAQDLRNVYIPFLEGVADAAETRKLESVK
jgi:ParB-like chromosome segregation protein Spo0J